MVIACHLFQARHGGARAGRGARGYTSGARGHASSTRGVGALESVPYFPHYITGVSHIIMQNPTDQAEASIRTPTTVTNKGTNWIRTVKVPRKAAKRTLPFDLTVDELDLVSRSQAEDISARKKPRLEAPLPTATKYEATRETASPDVSGGLTPPTADDENANADPVTNTQPNTGATWATGRWKLEEDAKLTRAVANTPKKKWGNEFKTDWAAISELVPGRTSKQCCKRWPAVLDPNIGLTSGRKGKWTAVEDSQLKNAVQTQGDKDWVAISLLVPGRTKKQCNKRWHDVLRRASGRKGKWTVVEDSKLKDAVELHGDKDWVAISLLVPGRTNIQCWGRWDCTLYPSMSLTAGHTGTWEEDEDNKLNDAVQTQGDKDWAAISALVPGRTRNQCSNRWHAVLDANIGQASRRNCKWTTVEDSKLKHAVQTHGAKGWAAISALVPGRTGKQCNTRWRMKKHTDRNRTTARKKDHGILKKAPTVGQDPHSP
jgi:hypothetical protein